MTIGQQLKIVSQERSFFIDRSRRTLSCIISKLTAMV